MDVMELRRRLMMGMGQSKNLINGSITLSVESQTMQISVPFEPKLFQIVLRKYPEDNPGYRPIIAIGSFFNNPEGAAVNVAFNGGYYCLDEATQTNSRSVNPTLPTYSNGIFTLSARSASFPWPIGTFDYIIAG